MKCIGVLTSGGDAPGMNPAVRAVVRTALAKGIKVMGINRGYAGLINGDIEELSKRSVSDIIHKGGTFLKSARCLEFKQEEVRKKAVNILKVFGIDGLVVVGGDGSFQGAKLLSDLGVATIGLPGTIDNDLAYTDYTIGFFTALNTVLDALNKIRDTSSSHERVSVLEVMGRDCGDLALYAGIAGGAEEIIVPEKDYDLSEICKTIIKGKNSGKTHHIILLAEGVGGANELVSEIERITGVVSRATILGHIQRGGSPVAFDRILASRMGAHAVDALVEGKTARVVGIKENRIFDQDITEALEMESQFDDELYELASILS